MTQQVVQSSERTFDLATLVHLPGATQAAQAMQQMNSAAQAHVAQAALYEPRKGLLTTRCACEVSGSGYFTCLQPACSTAAGCSLYQCPHEASKAGKRRTSVAVIFATLVRYTFRCLGGTLNTRTSVQTKSREQTKEERRKYGLPCSSCFLTGRGVMLRSFQASTPESPRAPTIAGGCRTRLNAASQHMMRGRISQCRGVSSVQQCM